MSRDVNVEIDLQNLENATELVSPEKVNDRSLKLIPKSKIKKKKKKKKPESVASNL